MHGIALLTLVPFYNFHALKFNANTVLIPFWAATTWWFLRSFETRRAGWAVLAGIGATAAMLGKYWSIFLIAGLGVAALSDSRRGAYFRSPAPWLTIAVGVVLSRRTSSGWRPTISSRSVMPSARIRRRGPGPLSILSTFLAASWPMSAGRYCSTSP